MKIPPFDFTRPYLFRSNAQLGDLGLVGKLEKSTIHPYEYWSYERSFYNLKDQNTVATIEY